MKKIDFLIVGCMKAGTTTLVDYLAQHPEIGYIAKEVQYFSNDTNFKKGTSWYHKATRLSEGSFIFGDKTTMYSFHPDAVRRIYEYNPNIKIIWIFREPISRTYSNYWHSVMSGNEKNSFSSAIESCLNKKAQPLHLDYLSRSNYYDQVQKFSHYYPINDMHYVFIEELRTDPERVLTEICSYIGIDKEAIKIKRKKSSNPGYAPYSIRLEYYNKLIFKESIFAKIVHRINKLFGSSYPPIKCEDKIKLKEYFFNYNNKLFKLIQKKNIWH